MKPSVNGDPLEHEVHDGRQAGVNVIKHWIDNQTVDGGDRTGDVYNPATGEKTASVVYATRGDVDRAVASAKKAFASWGKTSIAKRTRVLFAYRELVERNKDAIARTGRGLNRYASTSAIVYLPALRSGSATISSTVR